jgi:cation:H+ antiporter
VAYTIFAVWQSRRQQKQVHREKEKSPSQPAIKSSSNLVLIQVGLIVAGLGLLVVGARWLVGGAVSIAQFLGASELIVGLTVVAVGTSLPEIATSIAATLRGERDIAVGNAVGSNIFNILLVLGMAAVIAPTGIAVSTPALRFDIPVMIAVMIACLPIFFTDYTIARWEGFLFLAYYAAYTLYLVLQATEHDALPAFSLVMLTFVVPLTGITLLVLTYRAIRTNHRLATEDRDLAEGET